MAFSMNYFAHLNPFNNSDLFENHKYKKFISYFKTSHDSSDGVNINKDLIDYKYYKLYIYVNESVCEQIKEKYISNALKNNLLVDSYLESFNNNVCVDCSDFCFDAGFDLICNEDKTAYASETCILDHNVQCCMKVYDTKNKKKDDFQHFVGYYLYSRSSTATKTPMRLSNCVGIIDSGYRGNIKACFDNINKNDTSDTDFGKFEFESGNRYVQICPPNLEYPMKVFIVDNIEDLGKTTSRNIGGFGSTGS